ncbi:MAG: hypothetical protein Q9157_002391 [Trypethelium eluteriae]
MQGCLPVPIWKAWALLTRSIPSLPVYQSSETPMFQCKQCPKSYPTKNSLTRHERNHGGRDTQHRCDVCGVVFYRKDVYLRHSRIHEGDDNATSTSKHDRQRCHTACVQCRRARAKCDGKQPCSTCVSKKRKQCTYEQASSRLSHQVSPGASASSVHSSSEASPEQPIRRLTATSDQASSNVTDIFTPPASVVSPNHASNGGTRAPAMDINSGFLGPGTDGTAYPTEVLAGAPQRYGLSDMDTGAAQGLPDAAMDYAFMNVPDWQWLHQDLFFQTDPSSVIGFQSPEGLANSAPLPQQQSLPSNSAFAFAGVSGNSLIHSSDASAFQTPSNNDARALQATPSSNSFSKTNLLNGGATEQSRPLISRDSKSSTAQTRVAEELVDYAQNFAMTQGARREDHGAFWASMAVQVQRAFYGHSRFSDKSAAPHILQHFVEIYFERFHVLWTLFVRRKKSDLNHMHPILYLVMSSIGAMYEGVCGNAYGSVMHERIRSALLMRPCEFAESEQEPVWLCQALLLTQLQALYFGQRRAFSYAQHLGCILVAQARRMNLFSARRYRPKHIQTMERAQDYEQRVAAWAVLEEKTRIAYGIFRADVYMSVLLATRPFISFEELDIEASSYSYNINTDNMNEVEKRMEYLINQHEPGIWLSDLVRVALDREEDLPNLEPPEHEVLIFGLQQAVWRFCNDTNAVQRLTGSATPPQHQQARSGLEDTNLAQTAQMRSAGLGAKSTLPLSDDFLDYSTHRMKDMQSDNERLFLALQKWKQSFMRGQTRRQLEHERHFLLTGLLLYHISYLRINAPIESLHRLSYCLDDKRAPERSLCDTVMAWLQGPCAHAAVDHAVSIWSLVHKELQRPAKLRATLNLFSFIGLHHSGVIVWMYSCTHTAEEVQRSELARLTLPAGVSQGTPYDAILCRENMSSLLADLSQMFNRISPEWALRSSFAASAMKKANQKFSWEAMTSGATERV